MVLLLATALPCAARAAERSRYDALKRVIDRNTGFAHMTRGMNTRLLTDRDHVAQLSAANVLVDLGEEGKRGLRQALAARPDVRTRGVIEEALRDADSPTRRPIRDYPLSEQERQRIRGCSPPASRN